MVRLVLTLSVLCLYLLSVSPVFAGSDKFDDDINAKFARIKAKTKRLIRARDRKKRSSSSSKATAGNESVGQCGSINIGNTIIEKGSNKRQETIVVVSGDIINANNNCK